MLAREEVGVVINTVLVESDLPDLLLARDRVETMYLCSLAAEDAHGFVFLAIKISSGRLAALRSGTIDLRRALLEPEIPVHYSGRYTDQARTSINLSALTEQVPEKWLPEAGLYLNVFYPAGVPDEEIVRDAISRNSPVIVCALDPPEARGAIKRMDADSLADYIAHFQSLVRHATKHSLKRLSKATRDSLPEDLFDLRVFAFSPGSFNVHFEAKDQANMFGSSRVGEALQQIDVLMELASRPAEEARAGFKASNAGHVLAAYESLMKFAAHTASFSYRWCDPGMTTPSEKRVTPLQAATMVTVLEHEEAIKAEPFEFIGYFTSVNTDKKPFTWTARDDKGKVKRGQLAETASTVLNGVTIKTTQYSFSGEDRLVQPAVGRLAHRLFLQSVRGINL
jgi:hypothetical protein